MNGNSFQICDDYPSWREISTFYKYICTQLFFSHNSFLQRMILRLYEENMYVYLRFIDEAKNFERIDSEETNASKRNDQHASKGKERFDVKRFAEGLNDTVNI